MIDSSRPKKLHIVVDHPLPRLSVQRSSLPNRLLELDTLLALSMQVFLLSFLFLSCKIAPDNARDISLDN